MHSWVTMNAPCAVRMIAPDTTAVVPAAARMAPAGDRDPAVDDVDERALVEEGRRREVDGHEERGEQQEAHLAAPSR